MTLPSKIDIVHLSSKVIHRISVCDPERVRSPWQNTMHLAENFWCVRRLEQALPPERPRAPD
jgi:hypothetical protein